MLITKLCVGRSPRLRLLLILNVKPFSLRSLYKTGSTLPSPALGPTALYRTCFIFPNVELIVPTFSRKQKIEFPFRGSCLNRSQLISPGLLEVPVEENKALVTSAFLLHASILPILGCNLQTSDLQISGSPKCSGADLTHCFAYPLWNQFLGEPTLAGLHQAHPQITKQGKKTKHAHPQTTTIQTPLDSATFFLNTCLTLLLNDRLCVLNNSLINTRYSMQTQIERNMRVTEPEERTPHKRSPTLPRAAQPRHAETEQLIYPTKTAGVVP